MDDATAVLAGHSTKYNLPLSHFEHKYIQTCTDGKELERIYKELISGEVGTFIDLEKLTLDRLRQIKPNSSILRQDKAPLDRSALPADERQEFDDFLNQMKTSSTMTKDHHKNGVDSVPIRTKKPVNKSNPPVSSVPPVIKKIDKQKRIVPRSYDEWGKFEKTISQEANTDDDEDNQKTTTQSRVSNPTDDKKQRARATAEDHRLSGNAAFKANNYQQSIESYSNSLILDNTNSVVYMNRAIAYYKLSNYDASLADCSQVLVNDPNHIKALFRRASCRNAKQQYDEAKADLEHLLTVQPDNNEAKNLLISIPTVPKTRGVRIPITEDDGDDVEQVSIAPIRSAPIKIPIMEVDDDEEEEEVQSMSQTPSQSTNIDIPSKPMSHARPCIDSQEASPAISDHYLHHRDEMNQFQQEIQYQLSALNADDDDDMALGDEANAGLTGNMSDDDGHVSHSFNVSPTVEDDEHDAPELVDQKPLRTPPLSPYTPQQANHREPVDRSVAYQINNTYNQNDFASKSHDQRDISDQEMDDDNHLPRTSKKYSSHQQQINSSTSFESNRYQGNSSAQQRSSSTNATSDQISNSHFCPTIQNWLRDTVQLQSNRRPSSYHDKPWSKSMRPWSLDKLQRDIERFNRTSDFRNAVEASKKMLKNGVLDYHSHAEHIVNALVLCAQCYAKVNNHTLAIQFATEALQYNQIDTNALICRAKAFENENLLAYSYADYARIPSNDLCYSSAQCACEKLAVELTGSKGETWRDQLPQENADECYLTYLKNKSKPDNNLYEWYRIRGNQLYLDSCFILAILCYTYCTELQPTLPLAYLNRAACYLKVFEPEKTIDDCNRVLEIDTNNVRALYRKASAYKMAGNHQLHVLTLKDLIKLQPNNQVVLSEYYTSRQQSIPRRMRRLRTNPTLTTTSSAVPPPPAVESQTPTSTIIIEENSLTFEQLEKLRTQKAQTLSANVAYQFTRQLETLKVTDIEGQCSLMLRLPAKSLFQFAKSATPKLVETMIRACRTMVHAEKRYQQEHKSVIASFSYVQLSFQLLVQLTTLPRIDSALLMINVDHRASLDDLLAYFSSIAPMLNDIHKLDRLRK